MLEFRSDIITHVPTCCLVEDYQTLQEAINEHDWTKVNCVMECLQESMDRYTSVPDGLSIRPSGTSLIAMSCHSGIIVKDGKDINCMAGYPVSDAGAHCETCPHLAAKECDPENCSLLLEGSFHYEPGTTEDETLLAFLDPDDEKEAEVDG